MKNLLIILLFILNLNLIGQEIKRVKGKPKDLEESFYFLDQMFDDTIKYTYMTLPGDIYPARLHFRFGMWIRNNWGLWRNSELKKYFIENGITHPDNMSGIIFSEYYNYLNHQPYGIKKDVDSTLLNMTDDELREHIVSNMSTSEELMINYPIGDTIVVYISITEKKFFKKLNKSQRAIAKVIKHEDEELIVELLKIPISRKQKTEFKIGQVVKKDPFWCDLIPPKYWKWE